MKKVLFTLLAGLFILSASAFAVVDCGTVTVCLLARDDGGCHPAVLYNLDAEQQVSGTFAVCDGAACSSGCSDPAPFGPFVQGPGLAGVFLTFGDEPPVCTSFSSQWVVNGCDSACGDHHCTDVDCPIGAVAFLQEVVVN